MPHPLTAAIEAALATGRINYIDLVRIKLRPGEFLYWSSRRVPEEFTGEGIVYEDRIKSISALTFKAGFEDSTVTIVFSNADYLVRDKSNEGVIWERAEVSTCRLFPDLDPPYNKIGDWENPHWRGWIKQAPSFETLSSMKVSSGFSELNREVLRAFGRTDMSQIGSEQFPYNPLAGKGLPQIKASGTATGGTVKTLVTSTDISGLEASWLIFVKGKKIIGRIAAISGITGQVEVEYWLYGGDKTTEIIPESGDSWIAGPAYTTYDGMESTCKNMGMFGPHAGQSEADLNTDTRRYFYALNLPGNAYLEKKAKIENFPLDLYSSVEGEGDDGDVIPIRVGRFEADLKVLASGIAGDKFIHVLGVVGEGRIAYLGEPLLDGVYHVDPPNPAADANDDSWIEGGTNYLGANDQGGVDGGELTESQRCQAVGSREARARNHDENLDTYKSNPLGFNNSYGDGCSLAGMAWSRGRWEKAGYSLSGEPVVKIRGKGVITLTPAGSWVPAPNIIEFCYSFLINQRWGAKLSPDRLNISDFLAESAHASEVISASGSEPAVLRGTLVAGPVDAAAPTLPPCCVVIPSGFPLGETREDGLICTIETATKTYTMTIRGEATETGPEIMSWIRTPEGATRSAVIEDVGWLLTFYENFDGELPTAGDSFVLSGVGLTEEGAIRFLADGSLVKEGEAKKIARDIMKNCNGTFVPKRGRISPVIRRAVEIETINSRRTYTDEGVSRNVIKGTLKLTPRDTSKIPTAVRVEFVDVTISGNYQKRQITIRNTYAEERVQAMTGESARDKSVTVLDLCLTGTPEQAIRIGTRYLREHSFIREVPGYHPSDFSLEVPIHDAQDVVPVEDIHPIYSKSFPYWARYMRVEELEDNSDKGTVTIKGSVYLPEMYSDAVLDFIVSPGPVIKPAGPGSEYQQLVINKLEETAFRDDEGTLLVSLRGEITLPPCSS